MSAMMASIPFAAMASGFGVSTARLRYAGVRLSVRYTRDPGGNLDCAISAKSVHDPTLSPLYLRVVLGPNERRTIDLPHPPTAPPPRIVIARIGDAVAFRAAPGAPAAAPQQRTP